MLGCFEKRKLHVVLEPNNIEQVIIVDEGETICSSMLKIFLMKFKGNIGQLNCSEYRIILNDDACLKVHKVFKFYCGKKHLKSWRN